MSINIQFAQRQNVFTNMDTISGKVVLYLVRAETFTAINVKLEGESRTRLAHPLGTRSGDRGETELEVHKLLYNIQTVFPPNDHLGNSQYTLPTGQHEFPFSFRLPFNNSCNENNIKRLKMGGLQVDMRDINRHTRAPLPPTLGGFPGEAEIKYYVKATAERPAFYKENFRNLVNFKFLPIEKPRPPTNTRETYGRRKHQFSPHGGTIAGKPNLFRKPSAGVPDNMLPPLVSVDARLPDPAIITCGKPLPLRVLVTKLNDSPATLYLRSFQVTLWGHTRIRAHALERIETTSWVVASTANMSLALQPETADPDPPASPLPQSQPKPKPAHVPQNNPFAPPAPVPTPSSPSTPSSPAATTSKPPSSPALYPALVPPHLCSRAPLPASICPSFETCNLARWYELEVSVGLGWGGPAGKDLRPELTVQPIRLKVDVFSGIAPSPALVSRLMSTAGPQRVGGGIGGGVGQGLTGRVNVGAGPAAATAGVGGAGAGGDFAPVQPPRPGATAGAGGAAAGVELDPGAAGPGSAQAQAEAAPAYDEPPPSYEDAMADDLAPVDGLRSEYSVPEGAPVADRKRRDS